MHVDLKRVYLVVGWKYDPKERGPMVAFRTSRSSTPGEEVVRALDLGCPAVSVWLQDEEDYEAQGRKYIEEFVRVTRGGSYHEPPVSRGPTTCNVIGFAPDGKTPQGRVLHKRRFSKDGSTTPGENVERALSEGSTEVVIEVTKWGAAPRPLR